MSLIIDVLTKGKPREEKETKKSVTAVEDAIEFLEEKGRTRHYVSSVEIVDGQEPMPNITSTQPTMPLLEPVEVSEAEEDFTVSDFFDEIFDLLKKQWFVLGVLLSVVIVFVFLSLAYWVVNNRVVGTKIEQATSKIVTQPRNLWAVTPPVILEKMLPASSSTSSLPWRREGTVEGILVDRNNPMCLIDGQILRVGDSWNERMIVGIEPSGVLLKDSEGITFKMKIKSKR